MDSLSVRLLKQPISLTELHFWMTVIPALLVPFRSMRTTKGDYPYTFVAIGNSELRMLLLDRLKKTGYSLVTLIHPNAEVSPSATVGCGSVIEPMAVVQSNATIGEGTMIASGAVIKHNAVVGNGCYIDCNSTVLAGATVPNGEKVFANTVVEGRK